MKRHWGISRAFIATCLLAVSNVVVAPKEHIREAIATSLMGIAAAISGGTKTRNQYARERIGDPQ